MSDRFFENALRGTTRSRAGDSPRRAGRVEAAGVLRWMLTRCGCAAGLANVWKRLAGAAAAFAAVPQLDGAASPVDLSVAGFDSSRGFFVLAEPRSPAAKPRTLRAERPTEVAVFEVASADSPTAAAT